MEKKKVFITSKLEYKGGKTPHKQFLSNHKTRRVQRIGCMWSCDLVVAADSLIIKKKKKAHKILNIFSL